MKKSEVNIQILTCDDISEWKIAKDFRNNYFFNPIGIDDPYTWTFNHKEHVHLLLRQDDNIIGYAHIQ